jgi:hypothetical protein
MSFRGGGDALRDFQREGLLLRKLRARRNAGQQQRTHQRRENNPLQLFHRPLLNPSGGQHIE